MFRLHTTICFLFCLAVCSPSRGQAPNAFQDLPKDHWAYKSLIGLQNNGLAPGYPAGHFSGMRVLTRYELSMAVDRVIRNLSSLRSDGSSESGISLRITSIEDLSALRKLIREFKPELLSQGYKASEIAGIESRIDRDISRMTSGGPGAAVQSPSLLPTVQKLNGSEGGVREFVNGFREPLRIGRPMSTRLTLTDAISLAGTSTSRFGLFDPSPASMYQTDAASVSIPFGNSASGAALTLGNAIPNSALTGLLRLDAGSPAETGFFSPAYISDGLRLSGRIGGIRSEVYSARLRSVRSNPFDLSPTVAAGLPALDPAFAGSISDDRVTGVSLGFGVKPFGQKADIKLNLLNVNGDATQSRTGSDSAVVLGTNADLKLTGRLTLSADLGRTLSGQRADDPLGTADAGAYNLRLGFLSGGVHISAGYRYIDPLYYAPGYWGQIGSWLNPTNVQGPSVRAGFDLGRSIGVSLGGDFYTAAREGAQGSGLGINDDVSRLLVGLRWDVSRNFHTSVDWEGVYWTLNSPRANLPAMGGGTFHPTERYITLGTGYNLTRNMLFKLTYQVGDFNGQGLFSGGPGSRFTYTAVASQVAVKF